MNKLILTFISLLISGTHLCSAKNNISYPPLNTKLVKKISTPHLYSFKELINPSVNNKQSDHLLTRRKGEIKYSELKVYWKVFIKNLDKKKQNPDQVLLDKKKSLS